MVGAGSSHFILPYTEALYDCPFSFLKHFGSNRRGQSFALPPFFGVAMMRFLFRSLSLLARCNSSDSLPCPALIGRRFPMLSLTVTGLSEWVSGINEIGPLRDASSTNLFLRCCT